MPKLKYLSVCSGIEAATVAWHPLGWNAAAYCEIEPFPCSVLKHHYPSTPNYGDMTKYKDWPNEPIELLVGGTPCQSFSVAGLRKGLDDPGGNLCLTFIAIAAKYRPRWLVWENVPGVLSDKTGAFGAFLGGLGQCGYGFAYRVLDAQYFGVAQRRRRVFVVGYLGDWRRAAAVLFERKSLCWNSPPRREAGNKVAVSTTAGTLGSSHGNVRADEAWTGRLIPEISPTLQSGLSNPTSHGDGSGDSKTHTPAEFLPSVAHAITCHAAIGGDPTTDNYIPVMNHGGFFDQQAIIMRTREGCAGGGKGPLLSREKSLTIATSNDQVLFTGGFLDDRHTHTLTKRMDSGEDGTGRGTPIIPHQKAVRRLTPRECERLQGFPDDYTLVPYRNKPAADGPRYKALGNSMAVPVMRWIGQRIRQVEAIV